MNDARGSLRGPLLVATVGLLAVATFAAADGPTHPRFDSGMMFHDDTWTHTFDEKGTYAYHCDPHPWMEGTIRVSASDGGPATTHYARIIEGADSSSWGYAPAVLDIREGDSVQWTNEGNIEHTVTSLEPAKGLESPGMPVAIALLALVLGARRR